MGCVSYRRRADLAAHRLARCNSRGTDGLTGFADSFALGLIFGKPLWGPYGDRARRCPRACRRSCFLVDLLEESCNEPYRFRGCASTMACGFGLLRGTKPPCTRAAAASARWRGAPADAPPGARRGDQSAPPCGFSLGACWLVVARRRAGSRVCLGPPFARRGSVLATARCRPSNGVLYAGRFQNFTPP